MTPAEIDVTKQHIAAIDRIYLEEPTYGSRRMLDELQLLGYKLGRDRVRRLMRIMGIEPIYLRRLYRGVEVS